MIIKMTTFKSNSKVNGTLLSVPITEKCFVLKNMFLEMLNNENNIPQINKHWPRKSETTVFDDFDNVLSVSNKSIVIELIFLYVEFHQLNLLDVPL